MRVSKQQAAVNRRQIVDTAARRFREQGFDGVSVSDLMAEAGLTHGGFYGHFDSKEALMAEACAQAFADKVELWNQRLKVGGDEAVRTFAARYLARRHCRDAGGGCPLAGLGSDVARQAPPVRSSFTAGLRALVDVLARALPGRTAAARRKRALAHWSTAVGALVLARAVDDPQLSKEILQAASDALSG